MDVVSAAPGGATVLTDQASLLINELVRATVWTGLTICDCAGSNVPPESSLDTVLPGIDALISKVEPSDEIDHLVDRHTIAEDAGDEFRIVPELWIELLIQSGDRGPESSLIGELKVVVLGSVRLVDLDYLALGDTLGDIESLVLVIDTGEDLVGTAVTHTDEGDPALLVVLEANDVRLQLIGTLQRLFPVCSEW